VKGRTETEASPHIIGERKEKRSKTIFYVSGALLETGGIQKKDVFNFVTGKKGGDDFSIRIR